VRGGSTADSKVVTPETETAKTSCDATTGDTLHNTGKIRRREKSGAQRARASVPLILIIS
jgi:hypothetical protein